MKNFTVYWNDEKTAYVDLSGDTIKITRYVIHPVKQIFAKEELSKYEFGKVLEDRCWPRNRANIENCLKAIGLSEYNQYDICEKTHGVMFGSNIWFRFDGETICADDVLKNRR